MNNHPMDALKERGFEFKENLMDDSFDYPLSFFVKTENGEEVCILGEMVEEARGIRFILNPFHHYFEWYIEDDDEIKNFVDDFIWHFEELAKTCW